MKPILFHLFGEAIYSYPLLMGMGWGFGYNSVHTAWLEKGLSLKTLRLLFIGCFLGGWIGAKLFFLLFSIPDQLISFGQDINFWLGGGFVFYGGFLGAFLFAAVFAYLRRDLRFEHFAYIVPGLCLGHAVGRVGCFLAGCCYGGVYHGPLAVHMHGLDRFPVQAFEAFFLFGGYFYFSSRLKKAHSEMGVIAGYLIFYSTLRFFLEFGRGDTIRGLYHGLATSQWLALIILGITLLGLVVKAFRSQLKFGAIK